MKNMKKLISLLLVLLMLGSMFPAAFAEETTDAALEESAPAVQIIVMEAPARETAAAESESAVEETADPAEEPAVDGETVDAQPTEAVEVSEVSETVEPETDIEAPAEESAPVATETEAADPDEVSADEPALTDPAAEAESSPDDPAAEAAAPDAEEETQNAAAEADADYASRKKGELSGKTITIQSWDIQDMATNPDYSYLTFTFKSDEDAAVYEGCIAGISINYTNDTRKYSDIIADILMKVADNFYADLPLTLSDSKDFSEDCGLTVKSIDAEKVHPTATAEHPDTDTLLCWAATASNMLEFSGWDKATVGETFTSEDQVLDYFEKSFTDEGGDTYRGVKWFFDGVYTSQSVDVNTGEVVYGSSVGGQEKLTHGKNGGVLSDYPEECFEKHYLSETDGYDALYDAALGLKDGTSVGLSLEFTNQLTGHAITLLGYIRDTLKTGWQSLKALFVSDSDNNMNETTTREAAINSVQMFGVKTVTDEATGQPKLNMFNYSIEGDSLIKDYCTLAPYTADAVKEETGSKNAVNQVDFTVESVSVEDEGSAKVKSAKVGEALKFCTTVNNSSYTTLDTSNKPYCKLTYTVQCNGEVVATPTFTCEINGIYNSKMAANGINTYDNENAYTPMRAGNYTLSVHVDGIYYRDENGNEVAIPEAYTINNSSRLTYSFTVTGGDTPEPTPEPSPEPDPDQPDDSDSDDSIPAESAETWGVPVYYATVTGEEDTKNGVELEDICETGLTLMKDGKVVPAENYTLTYVTDGSVTVTFTQEYIDTLLPGIHTFQVLNESGSLIAIIKLTVE